MVVQVRKKRELLRVIYSTDPYQSKDTATTPPYTPRAFLHPPTWIHMFEKQSDFALRQ